MDRGAWLATVHGVTKSQTRLKQLTLHYNFCHLLMEMLKYLNEIYFQKMMITPSVENVVICFTVKDEKTGRSIASICSPFLKEGKPCVTRFCYLSSMFRELRKHYLVIEAH